MSPTKPPNPDQLSKPAKSPLHRLVDKQTPSHRSMVRIGNTPVGGKNVVLIAGPCSVESETQLQDVAQTLGQLGISCIRGGVFKPRTSPYSFQGLGEEGLHLLQQVAANHQLATVTEVMSESQLALAAPVAHCLQIGSRNMQNFELLKAVGSLTGQPPVILKRGFAATIEEFLLAAEYILAAGNPNVILCERGIRSFDPETRNVLDVTAVALLKEKTHLPVVVDPSHATGKRSLVLPAALAAVAAGADGILVEAHPEPSQSVSDADQALSLADLSALHQAVSAVASAVGRGVFSQLSDASLMTV